MKNYYVKSHIKGFYISQNPVEVITEPCQDCGLSDTILFSFNSKITTEPIDSMKKFLTKNFIFEREKLIEKIESYRIGNISPSMALTETKCYFVCYFEENINLLNEMLESKSIDKKVYDDLVKYIKSKFKKQIETINYLNYNLVAYDRDKRKVKVKEK